MAKWQLLGGGQPLPSLAEHVDIATESVSVGVVFKPATSGSSRNPPRKKTWNQNNRLQVKSRPLSGISASTGQLSRPWSGVSDSQGSLANSMSRSSSSPFLKSGSMKLPSLPKQPLSFEDMYSQAKKRAIQKSSQMLPGRAKPTSPSSSSQLAFALRNGSPDSVAAMALDVRPSREEEGWASATLSGQKTVEGKEEINSPSRSRAGSKASVGSVGRRQNEEISADPENSAPTASKASSVDLRSARKKMSASRKALSTASLPVKVTRPDTRVASEAYIKALRDMMEDGDYTRVDNFCSDVRVAIAGSGHAVEQRLQVQDAGGFGQDELNRMHVAFRRFKSTEAAEVHVDELPQVLTFLGYMKVDKNKCKELCADISSYSMLDFHEYVNFLEKFAIYERGEFEREFRSFDVDQSGMLNFQEVKDLIESMGVTPLRDTMREAFEVIDFDKSGYLDFEEFVHFMTIYRVTEGFTRKEVHDLKTMFDRVAVKLPGEPSLVPANRLGDVLARWFGPQSAQLAQKLARRFVLGENAATTHLGTSTGGYQSEATVGTDEEKHELHDTTSLHSLEFSEFLLWCRRLREAEIKEYRKQFEAADVSNTGLISSEELNEMLHSLGYMPLRHVIDEILAKVDVDGNGQLDFEEFVHLMGIFRKTDGFTEEEVAELTDVFYQYAVKDEKDKEGRVNCLKLIDLLRDMGYVVNLDKVRHFITEVDFDNTNSLDLSEFLRLMRLHRESELKKALEVFDDYKEQPRARFAGLEWRRVSVVSLAGEATLSERKIKKALSEVGYRPEEDDLKAAIMLLEAKEGQKLEEYDFDHFVAVLDACRKALVGFRRRHAGFPEAELKKYLKAFEAYDENGNGTIERNEMTKLLGDIGIPLRNKKEQEELLEKLDIAREIAKKAGVKEKEIGPQGSASVTFHTMLFLLRMLQSATDEEEAALETDMVQATGFSPKEIADFRDVFTYWTGRCAELEAPASPKGDKKKEDKKSSILAETTHEDMARNQTLSLEGMKRIVRSLGMHISPKDAHAMEDKLDLIAVEFADMPSSPRSPSSNGKYTFFHFLVFMRWMWDTNFCNVNECTQMEES